MTLPRVAVATSTSGRPWIHETIEAVREQTYLGHIDHYVFVNGEEFHERSRPLLDPHPNLKVCYLPGRGGNVRGVGGPEGTYAAVPYLVDADIIFICNDDDVYEPDHVESLVEMIEEEGLSWAYSLRQVVTLDGEYVDVDLCESLGYWPAVYNPNAYLVDCSCYAIRREAYALAAPGWYHNPMGDRTFLQVLKLSRLPYGCTGRASVKYRLQPHSGISAEFIRNGNSAMKKRFPEGVPWTKRTVFKKGA